MEDFQVTTADMLEIVLSGGNGAEYVNIAGLMEKAVNELREKDAENIRLREALTKIIRQHERFVPDDELGDLHYQGGLEVCFDIARAALAEKEKRR